MKSRVAERMKNSEITMRDPEALELLKLIIASLDDYVTVTTEQFKGFENLIDLFIEAVLGNAAYVEVEDGNKLATFDPLHMAYTESQVDDEKGILHQWIAYYSNCIIVYTHYPDHDEDILLFMIKKETYNELQGFITNDN